MAIITLTARSCRETAVLLRSFLYGTVVLKLARWSGGQFVLCSSACLNRMIGILCCALKFIFNNIRKKEMSPEAPIEMVKGFRVLLGAFAKLRKATNSFVMSIRPHGTIQLPPNRFSWNSILEHFSKLCQENSSFIKIEQESRVLHMKINIHFWSYLVKFFLEWKSFRQHF